MTKEQEMQDMLFETVELETPSNTDTSVTDVIASDAPAMTDPEWNDYVMSMFTDKEMYNGNPLVNGLRRVAEVVSGQSFIVGQLRFFHLSETTIMDVQLWCLLLSSKME